MDHPFFEIIAREKITPEGLETFVELAGLKCLFLWGHDCPNCEVAKRSLVEYREDLEKFPIRWAHCNVYDNMEVATRYGLHGIPVFLFFRGSKLLGKATSYPGWDQFQSILEQIVSKG